MIILGISAYYHDSAACLLVDGEIVAAAQEERFTRLKHDKNFPINAIAYCLNAAHIKPSQINFVVFYDKPFLKFERLLETYLAFAPKGFRSFVKSMPLWLKDKLFQKSQIIRELNGCLGSDIDWVNILLFSEHHISHAASAFFPSPFEEAAVLTMDGVGEWTTTSVAIAKGNNLTVSKEINFPHSLGLLYSAFTYYAGFKVNSGEYKLMGLAPYGRPVYVDLIKSHLIDIKDDGSFFLNMKYFDYCSGLTMTSPLFDELFGDKPRVSESALNQKHMDLAASIQAVTEEVLIKIATNIRKETNLKNLCLAGGVALNCVANGKLLSKKIFDNIWIQPAAGDSGGAIGAAMAAYYLMLKNPRVVKVNDAMSGSYLGPEYSQNEIEDRLNSIGAKFTVYSDKELFELAVNALINGDALGWHQGRMEFGPRALGNRSIIADPRSPLVQKQLNLKVKYRESFRPFAPSILRDHLGEWFELEYDSPYMLFVAKLKEEKALKLSESEESLIGLDKLKVARSIIPAVTHVDLTSRIQTVSSDTNPRYSKLLLNFYEKTGCPVLVNTSFNVRGEPIVNTPEDAFNCLMGTEIDMLIVGNCILHKKEQNPSKIKNYKDLYELD